MPGYSGYVDLAQNLWPAVVYSHWLFWVGSRYDIFVYTNFQTPTSPENRILRSEWVIDSETSQGLRDRADGHWLNVS